MSSYYEGEPLDFYDDTFFMSKAQVKASGWQECSQCLTNGRNLRTCSELGACRGPWSDGATIWDSKAKQLKGYAVIDNNYWGYADSRKDEPKKLRTQHPKTPGGCGSGCECIGGHCAGPSCSTPNLPCSEKTKKRLGPPTRNVPGVGQNWIHPLDKNQSPIESFINSIGNIFHPRPTPIIGSPLPQSPTIIEPIGYARRQAKKIPQDVPYSQWAPQMWGQFNQLAADFVDSNDFANQVYRLIDQIPCKECKDDADSYIKSHPPQVSDKQQAENWVKQYKNHVDQTSKKKGWGDGYYQDDPSESWAYLHNLAEYFEPETFAPAVYQEISELPPEWQTGCYDWVRINPPEDVESREQAKYWMCRFHNRASLEAGNGLVNCGVDPTGRGYISGHEGFSDFYYGGGRSRGGGHRGGNQQGGRSGGPGGGRHGRGGMRHGGMWNNQGGYS